MRPAVGGGGGEGENGRGNARGRRGASSLPGSNAFARLSFLWETVQFTKMLRVVSWNINGIRSPLQGLASQETSSRPTALRRVLDELDADIVCLQETKVSRDALTEPLAFVEGCNSYFSFSSSWSGYSGVATFCKDTATPVAAEKDLSVQFATLHGHVGCYGNMNPRAATGSGEQGPSSPYTAQDLYTGREGEAFDPDRCVLPTCDPEKLERLTFKMRFYRLLQT